MRKFGEKGAFTQLTEAGDSERTRQPRAGRRERAG